MRRRTRIISSVAALVAGVVFGAQRARSAEDPAHEGPTVTAAAPALAGRWTLDPEKSDDARQKMREAGTGRRGGAPGGGPPGGPGGARGRPPRGGPGGSGGGGRGPSPGGDDPREAMRAILEPAAEIQITPTEREIAILEKDGRLRALHPDGKKYKAEGGRAEVKTRWEGAELVVETQTARGGRTIETFVVAPAEKTLTITVRVEGTPMPALTLKRVYRLAAASEE